MAFPSHPIILTTLLLILRLGDIDLDGDLDIVVGRLDQSRLFLNDGSPTVFSDQDIGIIVGRGSIGPRNTQSTGLADINNNGILDLVASGTLMLNDESNNPYSGRRHVTKIGTSNYTIESLALGDVDDDGDVDVVFGIAGQNRLFINNGTNAPFSHSTQGIPIANENTGFTDDLALGDLDGDGDIDLITRTLIIESESVSYQNKMYLNNGTASPFDHLETGTIIGSTDVDGRPNLF